MSLKCKQAPKQTQNESKTASVATAKSFFHIKLKREINLGTSGNNASSSWSDMDCSNNLIQVIESHTLACSTAPNFSICSSSDSLRSDSLAGLLKTDLINSMAKQALMSQQLAVSTTSKTNGSQVLSITQVLLKKLKVLTMYLSPIEAHDLTNKFFCLFSLGCFCA